LGQSLFNGKGKWQGNWDSHFLREIGTGKLGQSLFRMEKMENGTAAFNTVGLHFFKEEIPCEPERP
jgi:hypothetical protein